MSVGGEIALRIIKEQELVIGPLAWREAKKVLGISVSKNKEVAIQGKTKEVLASLVERYEQLFGPASRQVCRDAIRSLLPTLPTKDIPDVLK